MKQSFPSCWRFLKILRVKVIFYAFTIRVIYTFSVLSSCLQTTGSPRAMRRIVSAKNKMIGAKGGNYRKYIIYRPFFIVMLQIQFQKNTLHLFKASAISAGKNGLKATLKEWFFCWRSEFLLNRHSKCNAIYSKIHFSKLLFCNFAGWTDQYT